MTSSSVPLISSASFLLQSNQIGIRAWPAASARNAFPITAPKALSGSSAFIGSPGVGEVVKRSPIFYGAILRVHFAIDPAEEGNWFSVQLWPLPIEDNPWLVISRTREHASDSLIEDESADFNMRSAPNLDLA
jgi:hypothetical protein